MITMNINSSFLYNDANNTIYQFLVVGFHVLLILNLSLVSLGNIGSFILKFIVQNHQVKNHIHKFVTF